MQTAQTRSVPFWEVLVAISLGAALLAAIGLFTMSDAINSSARGQDEKLGVAAVDPLAGATSESLTKDGHRYQLSLADGVTLGAFPARYQGANDIPADRSNHRYFVGETMILSDANHPENHRIGQTAD